jgi:hypothetical protein
MTLAPVIVTAALAKARPPWDPRVKVMAPLPARMFPLNAESVMVVAPFDPQNTLHACPPPVMTTVLPVPVRAPLTLNIQTPFAGPLSVNVPLSVAAASKQ